MGYKGIEITNPEDYIFSDTRPYNPEFDIEELKNIQNKIENFTSGKSSEGISTYEAEIFLDWVTFNARNYAVRDTQESPVTASMVGQCAPTQKINFKVLNKMGLDVKTFNMGNCIGEIPMTAEDIARIQNGWGSNSVKHSVALVNIPIMFDNGSTQLCKFQLDPTFTQFCKKEDCNADRFHADIEKGTVAPAPGYFMEAENLLQLGVSPEVAQKSEALCKCLISKGYFYLTEETAKLYGDAFLRASTRQQFQNIPIKMTGEDYIRNFENIPMKIVERSDAEDSKYTVLPSEMKEKKKGFFSNILTYFRNKFKSKNTLELPEARVDRTDRSERKIAQLSNDEMEAFRRGEKQILNTYNDQRTMAEQKEKSSFEWDR